MGKLPQMIQQMKHGKLPKVNQYLQNRFIIKHGSNCFITFVVQANGA
jgi:hypothetical protein